MSDHLPSPSGPRDPEKQPEVRLELTRAGVEQVLSLYAQEQGTRRRDGGFTLDLEDLARAFRERRRMLGVGLAAGLLIGLAVLVVSPRLYSVSAQVVVERHDANRSATADATATAGSAFVATQAEILASRSVVEAAVASLPRPGHLAPETDAVQSALEAVVATPVSGTQVVSLGYLGPDASYGAQLLEALVASYGKVVAELEQRSQQEKLEAKQVEVDILDQEAAALERQMDAARREHAVAGSGSAAAQTQAQIVRDYDQQIADVRNQRIALEARLATGSKRLAILDPATKALQDQLWQAEAELERLQLSLMPQHPAVETARQNVEALRKQLAASSGATPAALHRDLEATAALEKRLRAEQAREQIRLDELEGHRRGEEAQNLELERIREMARARRSELVDQRLLTRLAESGEVGVSARIIEAPQPPEAATWPRPGLVLPATTLFGVMAGLMAAIVSLKRTQTTEWTAPQTAAATTAGVRLR